MYAKDPLAAPSNLPLVSLLSAKETKAYLAPLVAPFDSARVATSPPKELGCAADASIAMDADIAEWLTDLAQHPDGRERLIRLATASGLADASRLIVCVTPTKRGVDVQARLSVKRFTGLFGALGSPVGLSAPREHYWAGAASLLWPEGYRAIMQLDKAYAGSSASRIDSSIAAAGTLLAVNVERAFVEPQTGRMTFALGYDAKSKRAVRVASAEMKSTDDAVKALTKIDRDVPDAPFERPRQKNEWSFVTGVDSVFVRIDGAHARAADSALGLSMPLEPLSLRAGAFVGTVDLARYRRLYERVGRVEDTKRMARDLMFAPYVDVTKTPHPKTLFHGVDRCDLTLERGVSELVMTVRCSRP